MVRAFTRLCHIAQTFILPTEKDSHCKGWHHCEAEVTVDECKQATKIVIQAVQEDADEIKCIQKQQALPKGSPLKNLDPFLDDQGLLRVGGRIQESNLSQVEKNPLIISGKHHLATLIVKHFPEQTHHQGRLLTE